MTDPSDSAGVETADPRRGANIPSTPARRWRISRRKLLAIGAVSAAGLAGGYYSLRRSIPAALIGAGTRGTTLAQSLRYLGYVYNPYVKLHAICDACLPNAQKVRDSYAPGATVYQDYHDVLARNDIKAVFVATPDFWHAQISIDAMKAGKAVYCEKPLAVSIEEGKRMCAVAQATNAVVQIGTQQRNHSRFRTACDLVKNGRLGSLKRIEITLGENTYDPTVTCQSSSVPVGLNWDLFLGPTPFVNYCFPRQDEWGHIFAYSGGELTGWGSHHLDIAHWVLGIGNDLPTRIRGTGTFPPSQLFDVPRSYHVDMDYPGGLRVTIRSAEPGAAFGVLFEGDRGRLFCNRGRLTGKPVEELSQNPLPADAIRMHPSSSGRYEKTSTIDHIRNFLECIETGDEPISDIHSSQRVNTALHLANISIRLGREIHFDPRSEQIGGDEQASEMMTRPRRKPYLL